MMIVSEIVYALGYLPGTVRFAEIGFRDNSPRVPDIVDCWS